MVPWGSHICQFYDDASDLVEMLASYFAAGLAANEYCIWVPPASLPTSDAEAALRRLTPDLDRHIEKGQIDIVNFRQWYKSAGRFEIDCALRHNEERYVAALAAGFAGLRAAGDTSWLAEDEWDQFIAYEEQIGPALGATQSLAICAYALPQCDLRRTYQIATNHDLALLPRNGRWRLYENPRKRGAQDAKNENDPGRLRQAPLSALSGMTTAIAHELAQPLTSAAFYLAGAKRAMRLQSGQAVDLLELALRQASDEVHRAGSIVHSLRDLIAKGELNKTRRSLHDLIVSEAEKLEATAGESGVEIQLRLEATNDRALIDEVLMKQAMVNLMRNAIEAMQPTERRELTISTSSTANAILVRVADTGAGLCEEIKARLFEPFSTTKAKGMGVGLWLARSIVQAHYGEIWAENAPDGGAVFHFTLPLAE
jgi:signal transduction histidine kinase